MAMIRHLLEALLNPFFISFLLFAVVVIYTVFKTHLPSWVKGCLLLVFFGQAVVFTGWGSSALTKILEQQYKMVKKVNPDVHWVVVLGGGKYPGTHNAPDELLTCASIRRVAAGVHLVKQLPRAKLIVSGGDEVQGISEASLMASLAQKLGVLQSQILLETQSVNTAHQARLLKPYVGQQPFYLVTSAIHMPRAMLWFKREGLKPIAAPMAYTHYWQDERWEKFYLPHASNGVFFNIAWHEVLGYAWAKIVS